MFARDTDDQLLRRLRRAAAAANATTRRDDRRRLLALESEISALRAAVIARRDRVLAEIAGARTRSGAVTAYARCAALAPRTAARPTTAKTART
ncbi:hypothetical protein BJ123_12328 [Rhodopseudomonas thermotolerans]|uniref:Uncharacterized protein n=2 Tax=Rhodopseudomonas TaxID=1073 RepID=A0A336JSZ0_9BRAD|nr:MULTISPECIES: hypothetical protein [Rhodopseudomonas]RED28092.1 hypothetical protein BJ125_12328 [Rhodopseudomonas pentothenatexigens]REF91346.1 hypothetical protein BJ123_12328 [Rhodopseudomonas thermotolerans]SSW92678.1 hypothetical protein SAMN05892882_12328 [Rhodopseudomonas pentothenatexigens]